MILRVVFDTTTVVSALLFSSGRLAWLRRHWQSGECVPLISKPTVAELTRVLTCPKFQLSVEERRELLAEYLPYCEVVEEMSAGGLICPDPKNQPFLDLAQSGRADVLVSGDSDLLELANQASFAIETPEGYRRRVAEAE